MHLYIHQHLWRFSLGRDRELESRNKVKALEAVSVEPELSAKRRANRPSRRNRARPIARTLGHKCTMLPFISMIIGTPLR
jgi:hypothetical protein